jgi:hypothetical protein
MPAVNLLACVMIAAILNTPAIVMSGGPTLNHVQEQAHGEVVNLLGIWRGASFADRARALASPVKERDVATRILTWQRKREGH